MYQNSFVAYLPSFALTAFFSHICLLWHEPSSVRACGPKVSFKQLQQRSPPAQFVLRKVLWIDSTWNKLMGWKSHQFPIVDFRAMRVTLTLPYMGSAIPDVICFGFSRANDMRLLRGANTSERTFWKQAGIQVNLGMRKRAKVWVVSSGTNRTWSKSKMMNIANTSTLQTGRGSCVRWDY